MNRLRQIRRLRFAYLFAAAGVVALALLSPLNAIANGVLFSAHMAQHLLLLLIAPALLLLAFSRGLNGERSNSPSPRALKLSGSIAAWVAGIGSMWAWHVPALCDAAVSSPSVHAVQIISLFGAGTAFWWPILAPRPDDRLMPGFAVLYLFTACLACTALGIILTLTPIEVCPVFSAPASGRWAALRSRLSTTEDRQIGGLLMWVPMCLVYLGAIIAELMHWLGGRPQDVSPTAKLEGHG